MLVKVLSEVTITELSQLKLNRRYKPIEIHYGMLLRGERIAKRIYLEELQELLKQKGINKSFSVIARWERGIYKPPINLIASWASCLDLKMSVFVDSVEHQLVKGDWIEKLKTLRKDRGIFYKDIYREMGVKQLGRISSWENRIQVPNESELKAWAQSLGATAYLVFERV